MPINRKLWTRRFFKKTFSALPCPNCQNHSLRLDDKSLVDGETAESLRDALHPDREPEWTEGRFACILHCENCSENVAVAGEYHLESEYTDAFYATTIYTPRFFQSAPHIFQIPKAVPEDISDEVKKSFELFWLDPSASGNRIRVSIELLLTYLGIPRYTVNIRHKREFLSLSSRIAKLKSRRPDLAQQLVDALTAIRHLGNAGSHPGGLTSEAVLDAMEILDHIFQELFVQHSKRIGKIMKEIIRNKGPRSVP